MANLTGMAPGRIDGPVYFKRRDGKILLAPDSSTPTPPNCDRCKVETLDELDRLQEYLETETKSQCAQEIERDQSVWHEKRQEVRNRLHSRMASSACSDYEKEFLSLYIKISDERKRKLYKQRFMADTAYFMAREFDDGGSKRIAESHDRAMEYAK